MPTRSNAAIVAGIIGILLVLAMLFAYYRWMTLVILLALIVWGLFVFGVASLISGWTNYALTLAGVTGIIVSIGVTVDSYVVFFERLKDELRSGRTFRNADPAELERHVADDLGGQPGVDHRRRHPVRAQRRIGARLRPLPRRHGVL